MTPEAVLAAILALPQFHADRATVSPEQRAEESRPIAAAIVEAARTPSEVAMLVALAKHESAFSSAVIRGACDELPRGSCDQDKTGAYRARGVFQLHKEACAAAFALPAGSPESARAEAQCAIRLMRWHASTRMEAQRTTPAPRITPDCKNATVAAFAGMGSVPCDWVGAEEREKTAHEVLVALGRGR